jgi:uncharacterized protein (DUF111 family)
MNPELIPPAIEDLIAAGARDAFVTPVVGKKGRPALQITALCDPDKTDAVAQSLFRSTTTLGLRMRDERRMCLDRGWKTVNTPYGPVRIKIGTFRGEQMNASPEYEDCAEASRKAGVSVLEVYQAAMAAATKEEFVDG